MFGVSLQAITELNFDVRDLLKNWLDLIDDGISQTPQAYYRAHLFEFAKVRVQSWSSAQWKEGIKIAGWLMPRD